MPKEYSRHQRLGAQILRTLNDLLRFESKDPGLTDVTLSAVELTRDLSVAKVYFSLLNPDDDPAPAAAGLQRAAGFLRGRLGRELAIRHVPELRFRHDDSGARGEAISRLIDEANRDTGAD